MKDLFVMIICFSLGLIVTASIRRINQTNNETLTFNNNVPFKEIIRVNPNDGISMFPSKLRVNKIKFDNGNTMFTYRHPNLIDTVPRDGLFLDLTVSPTSKYSIESTGLGSNYINTTKGQITNITYKQ